MGIFLPFFDSFRGKIHKKYSTGNEEQIESETVTIIIIIIITLFESQIILAEHECCTNWGDCKSNKSNQIKSNVGF